MVGYIDVPALRALFSCASVISDIVPDASEDISMYLILACAVFNWPHAKSIRLAYQDDDLILPLNLSWGDDVMYVLVENTGGVLVSAVHRELAKAQYPKFFEVVFLFGLTLTGDEDAEVLVRCVQNKNLVCQTFEVLHAFLETFKYLLSSI